jgi:hypothetical protein
MNNYPTQTISAFIGQQGLSILSGALESAAMNPIPAAQSSNLSSAMLTSDIDVTVATFAV